MKTRFRMLALSVLLTASAAGFAAETPGTSAASGVHLPPGIAWQQGDVDAAFALAKSSNKPLLLYWGAVWCPPCNQVKATIFSRQAFKDRSSFFVPVYLDGDTESAQKLGERFKVSGYPTMILFTPDGTEITRLPGEVDIDRYMQALSLGLNAAHPFKQTLAAALQGKPQLKRDEWRMLADYSWDTDGDLPVPGDRIATTLQTLSAHAKADHASAEALRLELKAIQSAAANEPKQSGTLDKAGALAALQQVLQAPKLSRDNFDILVANPADTTAYLSSQGSPERARLSKAWTDTLVRLASDASLSTTDRLSAVQGRVDLARLDGPKGAPLAKPLIDEVRRQTAAADKATTNVYERQSVVSEAGDLLTDAGLLDESDALVKASLSRSPAPYYLMSRLALNAKARGDKAGALSWYKQAYDASSGPATRLRWGAAYIGGVIELSPDDAARVQGIATSLLTQVGQTPNAFYGSNRGALARVVARLAQWNKGGAHEATVKEVAKQFEQTCGKLPAGDPQVATCKGLIQPLKA